VVLKTHTRIITHTVAIAMNAVVLHVSKEVDVGRVACENSLRVLRGDSLQGIIEAAVSGALEEEPELDRQGTGVSMDGDMDEEPSS